MVLELVGAMKRKIIRLLTTRKLNTAWRKSNKNELTENEDIYIPLIGYILVNTLSINV